MPACVWGRKETEYLGVIVGKRTIQAKLDEISDVRDWPLPETQRQIKYFVHLCSYYGKFIQQFSDCVVNTYLVVLFISRQDKLLLKLLDLV